VEGTASAQQPPACCPTSCTAPALPPPSCERQCIRCRRRCHNFRHNCSTVVRVGSRPDRVCFDCLLPTDEQVGATFVAEVDVLGPIVYQFVVANAAIFLLTRSTCSVKAPSIRPWETPDQGREPEEKAKTTTRKKRLPASIATPGDGNCFYASCAFLLENMLNCNPGFHGIRDLFTVSLLRSTLSPNPSFPVSMLSYLYNILIYHLLHASLT
jgi:hypothetical protein